MFNSPQILICDDDKVVHESLGIYLKNEGYAYVSAYDGREALEKFACEKVDMVILDLMMPFLSGTEVCKEIRKTLNTPIIMLTAKGEEMDRILGLELGADDYIVKPFSPREVVARIKAVLRRVQETKVSNDGIISIGTITINIQKYQILIDDEPIIFTPKEVEILYLLACHPGRVHTREQILNLVWGYEYVGGDRTVDTHIKRIRAKLPSVDGNSILQSIYGVGYKLEVPR